MRTWLAVGMTIIGLGAATGSAATAAEFKIGAGSAGIAGDNLAGTTHTLTSNAGSVKCMVGFIETHVFSGTFTTLDVAPSYLECTAFGFEATVKMNGCRYDFHVTETVSSGMSHRGTVGVFCPAGKLIEIIAAGGICTSKIGSQSPLGVVSYTTNTGSPETVSVTTGLKGITYTQEGFFCPGGSGTFSNGTYTGSLTVKAFNVTQINFTVIN